MAMNDDFFDALDNIDAMYLASVQNKEVDLETQMDIIEIGLNAIHTELKDIQKTIANMSEALEDITRRANGFKE